jgi:hypothetical protein
MRSTFTATLLAASFILLTSTIFGETQLEVAEQSGSPVQITAIGVRDNPHFQGVQMVEFTIQNIGQKKIIAFSPTLTSGSDSDNTTTYGHFDFVPGKIIQTSLQVNGRFKPSEKLTLSLDYILFSDLTGWGPDTQKYSESQPGYYAGERSAIDQVKQLIKDQNREDSHSCGGPTGERRTRPRRCCLIPAIPKNGAKAFAWIPRHPGPAPSADGPKNRNASAARRQDEPGRVFQQIEEPRVRPRSLSRQPG